MLHLSLTYFSIKGWIADKDGYRNYIEVGFCSLSGGLTMVVTTELKRLCLTVKSEVGSSLPDLTLYVLLWTLGKLTISPNS